MPLIENVPKTSKPEVYMKEFKNKEGITYSALVLVYKGYEKRIFLNDAERVIYSDVEFKI